LIQQTGGAEIYGRQGIDLLLGSTEEDPESSRNSPNTEITRQPPSPSSSSFESTASRPELLDCIEASSPDEKPIKVESSGGLFENISSFVVSNTFASGSVYSNTSETNGKESIDVTQAVQIAPTITNTTTSYLSSHFQSLSALTRSDSSQVINAVRTQDIALLEYLRVRQIVDLMVEKKKVKFGLNITSSEKADKLHRYRDFDILCLPYPGCEFFKQYRNNQYQAEGLVYDWQQPFVDAVLEIPEQRAASQLLPVDFSAYKQWDVITLTQNYIKLIMFNLVADNQQSMLIHCISGWDRTPLYISLLRLSLWADRRAHTSLSAEQITYLTLAYDWYLFGHNLADRVSKGEEILFFCFYFLKYIASSEYSVDYYARQVREKSAADCKCCGACSPITPVPGTSGLKTTPSTRRKSNQSDCKSDSSASPGPTYHRSSTEPSIPSNHFANKRSPSTHSDSNKSTDAACAQITGQLSRVVISQSTAKSAHSPSQPIDSVGPNTSTAHAPTVGTPTDLNDLQLYDIISLDEQSLSSNSSIETCLPPRMSHKSLGRSSLRESGRRPISMYHSHGSSSTGSHTQYAQSSSNPLAQPVEPNTCKFSLDDEDDESPPLGRKRNDCDLDDLLVVTSGEELDRELGRNSSDTNLIRRSNAMAIPASNRRPTNSVSFGTNDVNTTRPTFNQSNSSLNRSDSWQLVTETGSIRDKGFYSSPESFKSNGSSALLNANTTASGAMGNSRSRGSFIRSNSNKTISSASNSDTNNLGNSSSATNEATNRLASLCCCCDPTCARLCTLVAEQQQNSGATDPSIDREQRLQQVRSLFYSCYSSVIGYPRHRNGPDLGTSRTFQALFSQLDTIGINPFGRNTTPNL
jgi:hypothetical protein